MRAQSLNDAGNNFRGQHAEDVLGLVARSACRGENPRARNAFYLCGEFTLPALCDGGGVSADDAVDGNVRIGPDSDSGNANGK